MVLSHRLTLNKTLTDLPIVQFEQVVFALNPPGGVVPSDTAAQGRRVAALLAWAETTGPGIRAVQATLDEVLGQKRLSDSDTVCPYKGLSYFDCNDRDYQYFYGRKQLTETLLEKVRRDRFLAIVGASGSGKSSVLRAGLLQQLKHQGGYEIRILVPGEHPSQNLALAFVDEDLERTDRAKQLQTVEELIRKGADGLSSLVRTSEFQRVVLVVDQFEEAFTLCQDKRERQAFFETLLGALETASERLWLILAMRSDFVGKCFEDTYGGLAERVKTHLEPLLPMSQAELTQAITAPARQVGLALEPGLIEALLKDVDPSSGSLPLLQYTLTELWQRQEANQLKVSTYMQLSGVTGTLQQRADAVYDALTPTQQRTARHIFLSLTQLGEGSEDTRRRITQDSLVSAQHPEPQVTAVVKRLADANLVVTDERTLERGERIAIVDVAHEALIRNWPKLRQWLDENRDLLRQQRKIELAAEEWSQQKRKPGYLLQGLPLIKARQFYEQKSTKLPLSSLAGIFIKASQKQRRINRLKTASWLIVPAMLIGGVVEYSLRDLSLRNDLERIQDQAGTSVERQAIMDRVSGCNRQVRVHEGWGWLDRYITERLFGNCRSLFGASLSEAKLDGADLRGADLRGANFHSASLGGANLSNTLLGGADLSKANLEDAKLRDADLRLANFSEANLEGADLRGVDLWFDGPPNFDGASFPRTNLSALGLNGIDFSEADLFDANLSEANLNSVNLSEAILNNANLRFAKLNNTDLSEANLNNANLRFAELNNADLSNADLSSADLSNADLSNADLSNADLSSAILLNIDLQVVQGLTQKQLLSKFPPLVCNLLLPEEIEIEVGKERDCDNLPLVLLERYPDEFASPEAAEAFVHEQQQKEWD